MDSKKCAQKGSLRSRFLPMLNGDPSTNTRRGKGKGTDRGQHNPRKGGLVWYFSHITKPVVCCSNVWRQRRCPISQTVWGNITRVSNHIGRPRAPVRDGDLLTYTEQNPIGDDTRLTGFRGGLLPRFNGVFPLVGLLGKAVFGGTASTWSLPPSPACG